MISNLNIMHKKITYYKLTRILKSLGFVETRKSGSHTIFLNPDFNAMIVLPYLKKNTIIGHQYFSMIKRNIVEKGILSEENFLSLFDK